MDSEVDMVAERMVVLSARVYPLFRRLFQGYHPDEIAVLHALRASGGKLARRELINRLGIDQRIVSKRVRDLLNRGLVNTNRSSSSARESIDKITEKGNEEFRKIRNEIKAFLKQGFSFIDKKQWLAVENIIGQTNNSITAIEKIVNTKPLSKW